MTTAIKHAYVSGPLRQAIFVEDGHSKILSLTEEDTPRQTQRNDLPLFFADVAEFRPIEKTSTDGLTLQTLQEILVSESKLYDALDAVIGGMDRRFLPDTKRRKITEGDKLLADPKVLDFVEGRLFSTAPTQLLDALTAFQISQNIGAKRAEQIYEVLSTDSPAKVEFAFIEAANQLGISGVEATAIKWQLIGAGAFQIAAKSLAFGNTATFQNATFKLAQQSTFASMRRILFAFAKSIAGASAVVAVDKEHRKQDEENIERNEETLTLEEIIDNALNDQRKGRVTRRAAPDDLLDRIKREINWIEDRFASGEIARAENGTRELVLYQLGGSRPEDVAKTLTSIANRAMASNYLELAERYLNNAETITLDDAVVLTSKARLFYFRGQYNKALSIYDAAIERFPTNAFGYTGRAETLRALGRLNEALTQYDAAIERFPADAVGYRGRAETLRALGRLNEALSQYEAATERFPADAVGYTGRAETLRALGRLNEALAQYDAAIERFPADAFGYSGRAETLRALGRLNEALAQYDAVIERLPTNAVGYNGRAETLRALGHLNEALAQYEAVTERFPTDAVGYSGRAETLRVLGRLNEALTQYDTVIERFPTNAVGYNGRAETLRALGRLNEALAQYDAVIERFPTHAVGYNGRAETLRALGRLNEALAQYDAVIERFPTDAVSYNGRAETLRALGHLNEALAQYDAAIERFPTNAVGYSGRAETLRALGHLNEALAQYDAVIERFPTNAVGYSGRAETLRALGHLNEALAQYDAVIERFPTNAVGYSGRAETLRALGRLNEALDQYDQTIKRFSSDSLARRGRSYILILKGDFSAARNALAQSRTLATEDDWIATHMLGMADLREGNYEAAIDKFGIGSQQCVFATQKKYFLTALSISRLRKSRGEALELEKAEAEIERLKPTMTTPQERGVVLLLSAHAAAAKKDRPKAEQLIKEARTVISAEDFARKRLERELVRRFQLFEPAPSPLAPSEERQLDDAVFDAEFQLLAA